MNSLGKLQPKQEQPRWIRMSKVTRTQRSNEHTEATQDCGHDDDDDAEDDEADCDNHTEWLGCDWGQNGVIFHPIFCRAE